MTVDLIRPLFEDQAVRVERHYVTEYDKLKDRLVLVDSAFSSQKGWLHPDLALSLNTASTVVERAAKLVTCLNLRQAIRKLQWYSKVNRDGFERILGKVAQHQGDASLSLDIDRFAFASDGVLFVELDRVEATIDCLKASFPRAFPSLAFEPKRVLESTGWTSAGFIHNALIKGDTEAVSLAANAEISARSRSNAIEPDALWALLTLSVQAGLKDCASTMYEKMRTEGEKQSEGLWSFEHQVIVTAMMLENKSEETKKFLGAEREHSFDLAVQAYHAGASIALDQLRSGSLLAKDGQGMTIVHHAVQVGSEYWCLKLIDRLHIENAGKLQARSINGLDNHFLSSLLERWACGPQKANAEAVLRWIARSKLWLDRSLKLRNDNMGKALFLAVCHGHEQKVKQLLAVDDVNVNYCASTGETCLFVASRDGRQDLVHILLQHSRISLSINLHETTTQQTPLIAASLREYGRIVEMLLKAGADTTLSDAFGWTALDHVAFKGFWKIAKLLPRRMSQPSLNIQEKPLARPELALPPCPPSATRVFVFLGSLNTRQPKSVVDIEPLLSKYPMVDYPYTGMELKIRAIGGQGEDHTIRVPVLEDLANYPIVFTTSDVTHMKVQFQLFRTALASQDKPSLFASGVAMLESLKNTLGPGRECFIRDYTIPLLQRDTLDFVGNVSFSFTTVTPFLHQSINNRASNSWNAWGGGGPAQLVGHRGLGQNNPNFRRLQLGENTIQSFLTTIDLGVKFLECDVQLTRDHEPVIYHDFLMSESGADIAPHNLSKDQFMHISQIQEPEAVDLDLSDAIAQTQCSGNLVRGRNHRSGSLDLIESCRTHDFVERMKYTYEYRLKGFKGNIRGSHVHGPFTTLEELLMKTPEDVGIDVELKYAMLWEAEDWQMDLYGVELNLFADTVLDTVYKHAGKRPIVFTSFSPELCILLSHKQQTYPVMFLNESNLFPTGDVRASNLQEAIHFARRWALPGIVMSSEPFLASPSLVRYVKSAGLICASFGAMNDDPENSKIQNEAGVDAIIVDAVNLIAESSRSWRQDAVPT